MNGAEEPESADARPSSPSWDRPLIPTGVDVTIAVKPSAFGAAGGAADYVVVFRIDGAKVDVKSVTRN